MEPSTFAEMARSAHENLFCNDDRVGLRAIIAIHGIFQTMIFSQSSESHLQGKGRIPRLIP